MWFILKQFTVNISEVYKIGLQTSPVIRSNRLWPSWSLAIHCQPHVEIFSMMPSASLMLLAKFWQWIHVVQDELEKKVCLQSFASHV